MPLYFDFEQTPSFWQLLWLLLPEMEQVPSFWQLLWLLLPETEQVPALLQLFCLFLPEIEQDRLRDAALRGDLLPMLQVPLAPSHEESVPSSHMIHWSQSALLAL